MSDDYIPFLEIFLGMLGLGLTILFCTTFCKVCNRLREEQWRRSEQEDHPPSIYIIPFPGSVSQHDSEDQLRVPQYNQELQSPPPRYSTTVYPEAPPAYNELGFKPDDLPPAYTEYNTPVYPITPPPHTAMVQPQTQPQQQARSTTLCLS